MIGLGRAAFSRAELRMLAGEWHATSDAQERLLAAYRDRERRRLEVLETRPVVAALLDMGAMVDAVWV